MSTPINLPDTTAFNLEMESKLRVQNGAYHHLVGHGMHPDRDLVRLIDMSGITERSGSTGGFDFPAGFAGKVRLMRPSFFKRHTAAFDAKTAKPDEIDARLREIERAEYNRYVAALDARTMADLHTEARTNQ